MASESAGQEKHREQGHRNHFRLLQEEGLSWSGREPNTLFQNRGDGTFDEVGDVAGLYLRLDSRGAAAADLDGDGDLDLVVYNRNNPTLKIYRNDTPVQGRVALVDLRGTASETLAAGAQATLRCDGVAMLRQVELGSGFLSQAPPTLHFGLGGCQRIERIDVRWPSGATDSWSDLPVNHRFTLTEGSGLVTTSPLKHRGYNRNELAVASGELSAPRPDLRFARVGDDIGDDVGDLVGDGVGDHVGDGDRDSDRDGDSDRDSDSDSDEVGTELSLADFDDSTVVLNFWATWCTACEAELLDLEALSRRFASRVTFVGISLDEGRPTDAVQKFLSARGVTYEQVWGEVAHQRPFASLASTPPGAIPITAVLHRGTVRDVRVGAVDVDELAELLEHFLAQ